MLSNRINCFRLQGVQKIVRQQLLAVVTREWSSHYYSLCRLPYCSDFHAPSHCLTCDGRFWMSHAISRAWLSLQLLPQRLQSPTYTCLNRTQWGAQAGSNFLMTQSLKGGQEKGASWLRRQRGSGVRHGLTLGSIGQGERRRQRMEDRLRQGRFVGEAAAITP